VIVVHLVVGMTTATVGIVGTTHHVLTEAAIRTAELTHLPVLIETTTGLIGATGLRIAGMTDLGPTLIAIELPIIAQAVLTTVAHVSIANGMEETATTDPVPVLIEMITTVAIGGHHVLTSIVIVTKTVRIVPAIAGPLSTEIGRMNPAHVSTGIVLTISTPTNPDLSAVTTGQIVLIGQAINAFRIVVTGMIMTALASIATNHALSVMTGLVPTAMTTVVIRDQLALTATMIGQTVLNFLVIATTARINQPSNA
jgi:hypothetical protein